MFDNEIIEQEQTAPVEQQEQAPAPIAEAPKESPAELNFRALRQTAQRYERERDEALKRLQDLEATRVQTEQPEEDVRYNPEDLVEGQLLSKVETKVNKKLRKLEEELNRYKQQSAESSVEYKIKSQFPDFDSVVSKENIEALRAIEPELAQTLNASNDLYAKAVSAYKMIKKLGIDQSDPYAADKERVQKNMSKPRPTNLVAPQQGDSPLSSANAFADGISKEMKAALYKEMQDAIRFR